MPIGLLNFLEPEWDLPGSLPLRPMFEEGIGVIEANVMVLRKSNTIRQVLGKDEVPLGFFHRGPWYSSLAATQRNLCKSYK